MFRVKLSAWWAVKYFSESRSVQSQNTLAVYGAIRPATHTHTHTQRYTHRLTCTVSSNRNHIEIFRPRYKILLIKSNLVFLQLLDCVLAILSL